MSFLKRLRSFLRREKLDADLDDELQFHLDQRTQDFIDEGMTLREARYAARRAFGNVGSLKEETRDSWGFRFVETLWQDVRYGARMLVRNPGFTAVAVITLALGIGANTAVFSVVNAALFPQLPFPHADRLVVVRANNPSEGREHWPVSPRNFLEWREQTQSFQQLAACRFWFYTLSGNGEPEQVHGFRVSPMFFRALGVKPVLGRDFLAEEEQPGRDRVAILSDTLWQRRFGGDPDIVGRSITVDAAPLTVIGVLPPDFWFMHVLGKDLELWIPFPLDKNALQGDDRSINVYGQLKPGVAMSQAQAEMDTIAQRLEKAYPDTNRGWRFQVDPIFYRGSTGTMLLLLLGAVGFVLLIACANVANLLLARGAGRERETAIWRALGAGRLRILRQLLVEGTVLAAVSGIAALLLAFWSLDLVIALLPTRFEGLVYGGLETIHIDRRVLGFTFGISVLSAIGFGLVPALSASRPNLTERLKESGRGAVGGYRNQWLRSVFVVSQVALAVVLLVGAGLMVRSLRRLQRLDRGINMNVLTMQIWLPDAKYPQPSQVAGFYRQALRKIENLSGVGSASAISFLPLTGMGDSTTFTIAGQPPPRPGGKPLAGYRVVGPSFFQTMGIPLLRGRRLTEGADSEAPEVAVINRTMASRFWPNEDPIGKQVKPDFAVSDAPWRPSASSEWVSIVGVVGDIREDGVVDEDWPTIFFPYQQKPSHLMNLVVQTVVDDPKAVVSAVRDAVWAVEKDQPVTFIRTMDEVAHESFWQVSLNMRLLGLFAALAMLLAGVGVYGVVHYSVGLRKREIGIRMALGAQRGDVSRMVMRQGLVLALVGVGLGVAGGLALTRLLTSQLYAVTATDPLTFGVVSLILVLVALVGCYIPARRAMKVDPMVALRHE